MIEKLMPIVVANTLPAEILALSQQTLAEVAELTKAAREIDVKDAGSLEVGNTIFRQVDQLAKAISAGRLEVTRPIDALKKAIIAAEEKATEPLLEAKADLGKRIIACQKELERQRLEAEQAAREEAERKAAEERQRLEAERQAKIAQQEAERKAAEDAARAEAAMFGEDQEAAVAKLPPVEVITPVVVVPIVELPPAANPLPKSAVRTTRRQKLVIDDVDLIPTVLANVRLLIPDEKTIEKLMKAGVEVPGVRLVDIETICAASTRSK